MLVCLAIFSCLYSLAPIIAQAQAATPPADSENINSSGFRLMICDGPDLSHLTTPIKMTWNGQQIETKTNPQGYIPCDFNGAMMQIQHFINIAIIAGVLVAIAGFCYAGFLYISGKEANINKAKDIFWKLFIGFIIMLTAWFIVYQILSWLTGQNSGFSYLLGS